MTEYNQQNFNIKNDENNIIKEDINNNINTASNLKNADNNLNNIIENNMTKYSQQNYNIKNDENNIKEDINNINTALISKNEDNSNLNNAIENNMKTYSEKGKILSDNTTEKLNIIKRNFNTMENMSINNMITEIKNQINDLEHCLNPEKIKNSFSNLEKKEKFFILFLWLIWLINITIYITGDLSILFFSGVGTITYIFTMILCSFIVIIETLNIINKKYHFYCYEYLLFSGYFWILAFILFKSLLNTKGWGWQFYLIMILINLNLIIIPKFNNIKLKNE